MEQKKLNIKIEGKLKFEIDILQQKLLEESMRESEKVRRAVSSNITDDLFIYVRQKQMLGEPFNISIKGHTRSGKSTGGIFLGCYHKYLHNDKLTIHNICANEYEFLDKIKTAKKNDIFIIDESKEAVFGIGSMAKKMKLYDVINIIAKNNISTIWITPRRFNDNNSEYGLRTLGKSRGTKPRLVKYLLYNLYENSSKDGYPYGFVTLPHYADVFDYGKQLEKDYEAKKDEWIFKEQFSEGNVMFDMQKKKAKELLEDNSFMTAQNKKQKLLIAKSILPSEFTQREIEDICTLTGMIQDGII